jgi:acyl carrier protein
MDAYPMLVEAIATVCDVPADRIRPETTLDELDVDSLASAEIIFEIETSLGRELPNHLLRQIDGVRTVGDVAGRLSAEL